MISLITATFNASATLADNLASVTAQGMAVEHLIIDGGSADGTLGRVRAYCAEAPDLRRWVSETDRGIYDAMNKGIALATGDVVGILNADDVYASGDVLAKVSRVFEDPQVDACYGDLLYVSEFGRKARGEGREGFRAVRYWKSGAFHPKKFYWGWMPPHPTFFVRRSVYERFGVFNLDLGTAADYELMLRFLLKHRIQVAYIPEVLVHMRVGGASNATLKARLAANRMDRKAWLVNGLKPWPWTLACKPLRKIPQWFRKG